MQKLILQKIKKGENLNFYPIVFVRYLPYEYVLAIYLNIAKNIRRIWQSVEDDIAIFNYINRVDDIIYAFSINRKNREKIYWRLHNKIFRNKTWKQLNYNDIECVQIENTSFVEWRRYLKTHLSIEKMRNYKNELKQTLLMLDYPAQVQEDAMRAFNLEIEKIKKEATLNQ